MVLNKSINPYKLFEELKSNNSLYTTCEKSAKEYLDKKYNITFDTFIKNKKNRKKDGDKDNENNYSLQNNLFNKNKIKINQKK